MTSAGLQQEELELEMSRLKAGPSKPNLSPSSPRLQRRLPSLTVPPITKTCLVKTFRANLTPFARPPPSLNPRVNRRQLPQARDLLSHRGFNRSPPGESIQGSVKAAAFLTNTSPPPRRNNDTHYCEGTVEGSSSLCS